MDRAGAIKALQFYKQKLYNGIYNQHIEAFDVAISALREQEELTRNLQHRASNEQVTEPLRHNGFSDSRALLASKNQVTSDWISVDKRLPEPFVSVLGYCPDEEPLPTVHECYLNGYGQWCSAQVYGMETVTHWMPMPEGPEEVCK